MPPDAYFPDKVTIMEAEPQVDAVVTYASESASAPVPTKEVKTPPVEPEPAVQAQEVVDEPEAEVSTSEKVPEPVSEEKQ